MWNQIEPADNEIEVGGSRFHAWLAPASTPAQAKAFIASKCAADATHNAFGWETQGATGESDDDEPRGTAGKAILSAIRDSGAHNVAIVIPRWFGGKLLGRKNLFRTYYKAAMNVLDKARIPDETR